MKKLWASGFTLVELTIVIVVLATLILIANQSYNGVRKSTMEKAVLNDLSVVSTTMQTALLKTGEYPTELPADLKPSDGISLTVVESGNDPYYQGLTDVQEGVLFSLICQDLIENGSGQGPSQSGLAHYNVTKCGNWSISSIQIIGWNNEVWYTPLNEAELIAFSTDYSGGGNWNDEEKAATKNFYGSLVNRFERRGGTFPVDSFWDSNANENNGGVPIEPLPEPTSYVHYFCVEATSDSFKDIIWHTTENNKLVEGSC